MNNSETAIQNVLIHFEATICISNGLTVKQSTNLFKNIKAENEKQNFTVNTISVN